MRSIKKIFNQNIIQGTQDDHWLLKNIVQGKNENQFISNLFDCLIFFIEPIGKARQHHKAEHSYQGTSIYKFQRTFKLRNIIT